MSSGPQTDARPNVLPRESPETEAARFTGYPEKIPEAFPLGRYQVFEYLAATLGHRRRGGLTFWWQRWDIPESNTQVL